MRKIIYSLLLTVMALSLQSCLHDEDETFDTPAAQRLSETIAADKELLESATNGWKMTYYTGEDYSGGGFTYFVKFNGGKAHVSSDIADPDMITSSDYDVIGDQGPVLTFNTYNEIMHYLAQPYSSDVDGDQGDYEFVILKTSQDTITLKGKKWGNHMMMTRVADTTSWSGYLTDVASMEAAMMSTFKTTINGIEYNFTLDPGTRSLSIATAGGYYVSLPYVVTPTGVSLAYPLALPEETGLTIQNFTYDLETNVMTCTDASANGLQLELKLPDSYKSYEDFAGTYTLSFYYGDYTVRLVPAGDGASYYLVGLSNYINPVLTYNKVEGTLEIRFQLVYQNGSNGVYMCPWNLDGGGNFSWGPDYGMKLQWDNTNTSATVLNFKNLNSAFTADSFLFYEFNGTPSSSTTVGITSIPVCFGGARMPYVESMTKVE